MKEHVEAVCNVAVRRAISGMYLVQQIKPAWSTSSSSDVLAWFDVVEGSILHVGTFLFCSYNTK